MEVAVALELKTEAEYPLGPEEQRLKTHPEDPQVTSLPLPPAGRRNGRSR